jgi:hypothetical protein
MTIRYADEGVVVDVPPLLVSLGWVIDHVEPANSKLRLSFALPRRLHSRRFCAQIPGRDESHELSSA